MNTKIQEIIKKCSTENNFDKEKFANLIIDECLDACQDTINFEWLIYPTSDRVIKQCQNHIKSRFELNKS
jgi:hypothetical protein